MAKQKDKAAITARKKARKAILNSNAEKRILVPKEKKKEKRIVQQAKKEVKILSTKYIHSTLEYGVGKGADADNNAKDIAFVLKSPKTIKYAIKSAIDQQQFNVLSALDLEINIVNKTDNVMKGQLNHIAEAVAFTVERRNEQRISWFGIRKFLYAKCNLE